jgi:predicted HTH domain antitoxin
MTTLEIPIPENLDLTLGLRNHQELSEQLRMLLAVKLFELDRLTSGKAAELAGIDRETFLLTVHRYGVPAVRWDEEEIQAEADAVLK